MFIPVALQCLLSVLYVHCYVGVRLDLHAASKNLSTQDQAKWTINHQKYCQVFIPNFHPFSLIVLKSTVCLFVFFSSHLYTGKC